jgi:hypothetical protein
MNIPRRIAALKREIQYRQDEIARIAALHGAKEEAVIAFPNLVEKYLADIGLTLQTAKSKFADFDKKNTNLDWRNIALSSSTLNELV